MKDFGLVSIITPAYNVEEYIEETILSVLGQTYTNWELLITDDCSTDATRRIVEYYTGKDNRIKLFVLTKNAGAGVARNHSIKQATGRFIAFCDSDDRWYPHKLEQQLNFMVEHKYEFTYTSYDICNEEGEIIQPLKCPMSLSYFNLLCGNRIGCLTSMYDTKRIGKKYMHSLRKRQDWGLWLQIIKETGHAYGLQESLAIYRDRKHSISSNKIAMLKYNFQLYHKVEGLSYPTSFILLYGCFLPYYFYDRIKTRWIRKMVKLTKLKKS